MNHQGHLEDEYVQKFIRYVKKQLVENFRVSDEDAEYYIEDSSFMEMLKEDQEFVLHYSSRYWANNIAGEHQLMLQYA